MLQLTKCPSIWLNLVENKKYYVPVYLIVSMHECACLRELFREELQVKRTIIGEYYSSILCYYYWQIQ